MGLRSAQLRRMPARRGDCWLLLKRLRHTSGTLAVQSQSQGSVACMGVNKWGFLADHAQELQQARSCLLAPSRPSLSRARGMGSPLLLARNRFQPVPLFHYAHQLSHSVPIHPEPSTLLLSCIAHPPLRPLLPVRHLTSTLPPVGPDVGRFPATSPTALYMPCCYRTPAVRWEALQHPAVFAGLTLRTSPGLEC
jgi:hypothetical protein